MKTRWITRSLLGIGLASLFSDFSHEMVTAVLPAFLASIGAGAAALGMIEGASDAISSFVKLYGGWLGDRPCKKRGVMAIAYAITGFLLPFAGLATRVWQVFAVRVVAWTARGFRSPLRDAVLVDSIDPAFVTRAFGFHRAMDTTGAFIGPAIAAIALALHQSPAVIIFSAIVPGALAPLAILLVKEPAVTREKLDLRTMVAAIPRTFGTFLSAVNLFGFGNFSHTLLILLASTALAPRFGSASAGIAVGLYTMHNLVYAGLAYPMGRLGERFGPAKLLLVGYSLFVVLCALIAWRPQAPVVLVTAFVLAGSYIAIVDPMEPSTASTLLPSRSRGLGFGTLAAVNGLGDFVSSAGVGLLWARFGPTIAFAVAGCFSLAGAISLIPTIRLSAVRAKDTV